MQPGDLVGQTLGHYRIKREVGHGGMAAVFLAEDIHLGREVALKVFWPRPGETQDFLRRFAREARVLAQLDHPNILPVYDYGEQGELAYLVTPYMSGGTLKEVLRKRRAFPPSEATELICQVLSALQYAHDRNLIHRDIKPGNLLFKGNGNLVLADFGLVKVLQGEQGDDTQLHTLSQSGQITGTPEYMAPEQINGKAEAASDIYSMGVVLYEMVTGMRPFTGDTLLATLMKHAQEQPRPPRELNPYVPPRMETAILKALEKDPYRRFARPIDFQQALQQVGSPASNPGVASLTVASDAPGIEDSPTAPDMQAQAPGPDHAALAEREASFNGPHPPLHDQPDRSDSRSPAQTPVSLQARQRSSAGSVTPLPPAYPWVQSQTIAPPSEVQQPQGPSRHSRTPAAVLAVLLVLLVGLVASLLLTPLRTTLFGQHLATTPTSASRTVTVPARLGTTPTPGNTQAMPPTSTACPADGTARPATLAALSLGHDPTIVYIVNESDARGNPTFGTIKIYNTVTGAKKELAKTSSTEVTEAQVSNDGQWVLFVATVAGVSELRLVRLDGQGLQTLLCAPSGVTIRDSQWSIDQLHIIFDEFPRIGEPTVYLLNILTGKLQVEVVPPASGLALVPRTWLDNARVLMVGIVPNSDAPAQNIYILNIANGSNQNASNVTEVFNSSLLPKSSCWDFDTSFDAQSLFIAQCVPGFPTGSSQIVQRPVAGGSSTTVLTSSTLAFNTVRVIDPHNPSSLLALAADPGPSGPNGDPTHDGLYFLNLNTPLSPTRLTDAPADSYSILNAFSQYFWSNVSRDDTMYALETITPGTNAYALSYGPLYGGEPTTFASIADTVLEIAGWTTT
jgi:serine/threonine protein kinase